MMTIENVIYLYVKSFRYKDEDHSQAMNDHPLEGRVYRALKTEKPREYKIHIGADNNPERIDGIRLKGLKCNNKEFQCELIEINNKNILELDISDDDLSMMNKWNKEKNKSLLDLVNGKPSAVDEVEEKNEEFEISEADLNKMLYEMMKPTPSKHTDYVAMHDEEMAVVLADLIDYIISTYGDKYEKSNIPVGPFIVSQYGKGYNCGNALKYLSRYCTEGYEKSDNVKDIFKAIHYLLFEIKRRYTNG